MSSEISEERYELTHHLPGLAWIADAGMLVLGGEVGGLSFEQFEQLEDDWAHENHFQGNAAVWRTTVAAKDAASQDEGLDPFVMPAQEGARLVQLAATVVCEQPLPDPILSMLYRRSAMSVVRTIGPFERTWLLSDQAMATPTREQWEHITALADRWRAGGLSSESAVFQPLHAFGSVRNTLGAQPALMMMPIIVALEGIYAPGKAPGIAARMTANIARVLPAAENLKEELTGLYAIRSDIIHGRPFSPEQAEAAFHSAGSLACRVSGALASAMANAKSTQVRTLFGAWV